ncbi:MAG: lipoprotein-releasing system transmembrane subunit LolC [Deltaproteobacteria bacterium CG12_big_fil_rev_8_21_14_0_65_43_10]|nr:MAG: ABC transporter permease [Deltaproteobacteria bacterium CG2_30_43_15]PIQ45027.1 MAG: lipoprotein-releasing system transmembrane subunit LolC [Deltaproteobacteria bacterium CG12_big_fil_rev_8_21_14_0_65_43_10]PIU86204.1 MAG: lipoprotein-releasing system transmembrane subunit LolC [Deltaproteobacteria bacterium CG06_land_8_20_14_3_00_44_19]PIX24098.1 MAG: lipoprotein-releasing system transmembrane subunit LolC [Deltaproteobacteria bacterium CG_4_8_14_3_um_filter_43_13]PIZ19399.1 MAG: lipo
MSYELFIGLRYLKAKRKQTFISIITLISIGGVAIGVMTLIVVIGVMTGFKEDLTGKILGYYSHIVVLKQNEGLDDYERIMRKIEKVKGVKSATPFTYTQAMLSSKSGSLGVVLRGVDPKTIGKVINIGSNMKEGSLLNLEVTSSSATNYPGIIIGKELSRNLGIFYGDTVNLISPMGVMTPMGMVPRMKKFKIVGIFESGMYEYDSSFLYISLKNAQDFMNMPGVVTGIEVKTDDIYRVKEIASRIVMDLGYSYWTKDWMEMNRNLFAALKLEKITMFIILILIIMVAAFNIVSTLIMVVMEKNKDIAILKSMGATASSIMKIFIIEGLVVGVVGTLLGTIGGYTLGFLLSEYKFIKLPSDVYYISTLPIRIDSVDSILIAISAIGISFLATLYPSWQASRLLPAEALRYE